MAVGQVLKQFRKSGPVFWTLSFLAGASAARESVSGFATSVHSGRYPHHRDKSASFVVSCCPQMQKISGPLVPDAMMLWDG